MTGDAGILRQEIQVLNKLSVFQREIKREIKFQLAGTQTLEKSKYRREAKILLWPSVLKFNNAFFLVWSLYKD